MARFRTPIANPAQQGQILRINKFHEESKEYVTGGI